jgi:hypothetical protein
LANAIFSPWTVDEMDISQYGSLAKALDKLGPEPEWDRAVFTAVFDEDRVSRGLDLRTGRGRIGWQLSRRRVPDRVWEIAASIHSSLMAVDPVVVVVIAEKHPEIPLGPRTIRAMTSIGQGACFWTTHGEPERRERLAMLFGELVDLNDDWRTVLPEDEILYGRVIRVEGTPCDGKGTPVALPPSHGGLGPDRYIAVERAPLVTGDLAIVPEGVDSPTAVRVRIDQLRVRQSPPEVRVGAFRQPVAGTWRLVRVGHIELEYDEDADISAWLDGRADPSATLLPRYSAGPTDVDLRIELTIRPDGSFYELTDGRVDAEALAYSGEDYCLGSVFHGYVFVHDGRDYLRSPDEGCDWGSVGRNMYPDIVEELILGPDNTLTRVQNVVDDGMYRIRVTLEYRRFGEPGAEHASK